MENCVNDREIVQKQRFIDHSGRSSAPVNEGWGEKEISGQKIINGGRNMVSHHESQKYREESGRASRSRSGTLQGKASAGNSFMF